MDPRFEMAAGGVLMSSPWWAEWLAAVNQVASTIAVVCGAILGVVGVYRMWKSSRRKK